VILRRRPDSRFSEVAREWDGGTTVLIGGGPSLTDDQVRAVSEKHARGRITCIAVNDAYQLAPWAEICYFADSKWWERHHGRHEFVSFAGQKCSIQDSMTKITDDAVHILRNRDFPRHGYGLSLDPAAIVTGRNGGFQALNLAVLAGSRTAILLGFDGQPGADGKTHWHYGHGRPTHDSAYEEYRNSFASAATAIREAGVRVINCSSRSVIDVFEKMTLEKALCESAAAVA